MFRLCVLFTTIFSTLMWAHAHDERVGTAVHRGEARILHDGDYVDFNFQFSASCYNDQESARAKVIENVEAFLAWLSVETGNHEQGSIDHHVDLINVYRSSSSPYIGIGGDDGVSCGGEYVATQNVGVTFSRSAGQIALDTETIQAFFNSVQITIGPLNYAETTDDNAYVSSKVWSVQKGYWEETAEQLRIAAKAKAQEKATRDFLAFLPKGYLGAWHLHTVDFSGNIYGGYVVPVSMEAVGGQIGSDRGYQLSQLKLEPLTYEIEGNFVFHFEVWDNYLP